MVQDNGHQTWLLIHQVFRNALSSLEISTMFPSKLLTLITSFSAKLIPLQQIGGLQSLNSLYLTLQYMVTNWIFVNRVTYGSNNAPSHMCLICIRSFIIACNHLQGFQRLPAVGTNQQPYLSIISLVNFRWGCLQVIPFFNFLGCCNFFLSSTSWYKSLIVLPMYYYP